jgi:hypothetical protein
MTEYSKWAKGTYIQGAGTLGVSAPNVTAIALPFQPNYVELINLTQSITPAQHGIPFARWDAGSLVTISSVVYNPTIVEIFNATPVLTTDSVLTNGISAYSAGLSQQFGANFSISGITKATQAVVTTTAPHGYSVGSTVILQGIALATTNNMQLLNNVPFTIVAVGSTTSFTINWNTSGSNYTAITGSPAGAIVKQVLYPFLYPPQDNVVVSIALGATTTIGTAMYHNFETGQEVAFRVPNFWGTIQLNSLPNLVIPGSPIYGYITSVTDNWTFTVNINSTAFTAFTVNATMTAATLPGLTYAQAVPVGDINTGSNLYTGAQLYPPPQFPTFSNKVSTINGSAIKGAFVNNTSQGFIVGQGPSKNDTTSWVGGSTGDVIEYRAYYYELANP